MGKEATMRRPLDAGILALTLVLALVSPGCEKSDDDEFGGTYVGDGIDSQNSSNRKEFTLNLGASGTTVSGTYQLKAILLDVNGIVNGTLAGSEVALVLTPTGNDCPYRVNGVWTGGRITGTYTAFNCFVRSDGALDLKKK
jgi:hypothetical protein